MRVRKFNILRFSLMFFLTFFLDSCSSLKSSFDVNGNNEDVLVLEEDETQTVQMPDDLGDIKDNRLSDEERAADQAAQSTFPLVYNGYVEQWVNYFTGRGRPHMARYIERSTRYIGLMREILKEEGLPEDLIYLSMIESGFITSATSHVGAKGPWQFMPYTGKRFGLETNFWIDERRDYIKSTRAAATYLKELHHIFGSWYLAAAGYNAGEGRVLGAIREYRTRNFWELQRQKKAFRNETRNYVPKIIAAAIISKNPENYGFKSLNYEPPLAWEEVEIPGRIGLRSVAKVTSTDFEDIKLLNPELRLHITPADQKTYTVRIAPGKTSTLLANLDKLEKGEVTSFAYHKVRRGETLGHIARAYRSSVQAIMELNKIKSARRLRPGQKLAVPLKLPGNDYKVAKKSRSSRRSSNSYVAGATGTYKVKSGDTLWGLSQRFNVSVATLKKWNGLRNSRSLKAGMVLKVTSAGGKSGSSSQASKEKQTYRVRRGDTLWSIASKHGLNMNTLKRRNGIAKGRDLQAGQVLRLR